MMFGKAIVLADWGLFMERYMAWKKRRSAAGITLRYDKKRDSYYDPVDRFEGRVKGGVRAILIAWCWTVPPFLVIVWVLVWLR